MARTAGKFWQVATSSATPVRMVVSVWFHLSVSLGI